MTFSSGRHRCRCTDCTCPSSAYHAGDPCPSCAAAFHRPEPDVQRHVRAGLDEWRRLMPVSAGSSGLTDKQLRNAGEAWHEWHRREGCPIGWTG